MTRPKFITSTLAFAALAAAALTGNADAADKKEIAFLAGRPSHGSGEHEFYAGAMILAKALNEQSGLPVNVTVYKHTWPEDPAALEKADAIVLYMDGGGGHPAMGKLDVLADLAAKGKGIMCMHYGVEVPPGPGGEAFTKLIGGFYESKFSVNPHWDASTEANQDHPVGRGVTPVTVHDEWYFNIRFPEPAPAALLTAVPEKGLIRRYIHWNPAGDEALGTRQALMWGVERADGGRGIGFTGGHWHNNWAIDSYRKAVLNALVWVAGLDVPEGGVKSEPVSEAQLNENLDPKNKINKISLPEVGIEKK